VIADEPYSFLTGGLHERDPGIMWPPGGAGEKLLRELVSPLDSSRSAGDEDLRDGSWLASAHGEGVESIVGVQGFGAPDARHRLRDEERAVGRQRSAYSPQK
jgi:hypothetical protein